MCISGLYKNVALACLSVEWLCEKTKQFNEQLHAQEATAPSFTASSGWLWRFCNRHGIHGLRLQGEKLSADTEAPEPFKKELQDIMEHLQLWWNVPSVKSIWFKEA